MKLHETLDNFFRDTFEIADMHSRVSSQELVYLYIQWLTKNDLKIVDKNIDNKLQKYFKSKYPKIRGYYLGITLKSETQIYEK